MGSLLALVDFDLGGHRLLYLGALSAELVFPIDVGADASSSELRAILRDVTLAVRGHLVGIGLVDGLEAGV